MEKLIGIPGTISESVRRLRWLQVADDVPIYPGIVGRAYDAECADGRLRAIVAREPTGKGGKLIWHISVSHQNAAGAPDRVPTWDELKHAAYRLVPADVPLVLIFPRRSTKPESYVNIHETCLHLWEAEHSIDL